MGSSKQLLPLANKPVIQWCLDGLIDAGLKEIVVVLGPTGQEITEYIKDYPLKIAWNNEPESDMAGSLKIGLGRLHKKISGVLVCLVDHPLVSSETIKTILDHHSLYPDKMIIPSYLGQKGHPTLFPRDTINEIFFFPTLREIVRKNPHKVHLVNVLDESVLHNINTPDSYQKIQSQWSQA